MAGLGLDSSEAWPALLADGSDATVDNLGCSGAGFVAVGDCGTDFDGLIDSAVADSPDIVIIQSSDNDADESDDDVQTATVQTVADLHAALPNAQIVAFSTLWDQPTDAPDSIEVDSDALQEAVAEIGGVPLDLGQPLAGQEDLLQSDDEHPTAEGQQVLAQDIKATLDSAGIAL
jgi:lysophospholipase L1-like esterase